MITPLQKRLFTRREDPNGGHSEQFNHVPYYPYDTFIYLYVFFLQFSLCNYTGMATLQLHIMAMYFLHLAKFHYYIPAL